MSRHRRRQPSREQYWRDAITAWEQSGLPVRRFCADRGLSEPSFYAWRRTFRDRSPQPTDRRGPKFVPLRVIPDSILEVVLPAGVVLRVPTGADPAAVAKLVAALGDQAC
jgi:hypothetical protein